MNMIVIEPRGGVKSLPFNGEFSEIQKAVGGHVERISFDKCMGLPIRADIFVDEEGIPKGLPGNLIATLTVVCSVASQPDIVSFPVSLYGNAVLVKPFRNGWSGFDEDETARLLELLCKGLGAERHLGCRLEAV